MHSGNIGLGRFVAFAWGSWILIGLLGGMSIAIFKTISARVVLCGVSCAMCNETQNPKPQMVAPP